MRGYGESGAGRIGGALLHRFWLLILCAIIMGGLAYFYTAFFVTPLYRAEVSMYVSSPGEASDSGMGGESAYSFKELAPTYANIVQSNRVLAQVLSQVDAGLTVNEIRNMVTAGSLDDSGVFEIYVDNADPVLASKLANLIANEAQDEIPDILAGSSFEVIDYADVPQTPHSPDYRLNVLIGAVIGFVAALIFVLHQALQDKTVSSEDDLEELLDVPILGMIPKFGGSHKGGYYGDDHVGYGGGYGAKLGAAPQQPQLQSQLQTPYQAQYRQEVTANE
jgi:capsular polysaccharide biosynthesis protein